MKLKELLLEHMVTHLLEMCRHELNLSTLPKIELVNDYTVGDNASFGLFDGSVKVAIKERHPMDIMRTLAHELVHFKQKQIGKELDGRDGSQTENDANAIAGVILRKFGRMYPEYFIQTLP